MSNGKNATQVFATSNAETRCGHWAGLAILMYGVNLLVYFAFFGKHTKLSIKELFIFTKTMTKM